jgi:hypothetical protein
VKQVSVRKMKLIKFMSNSTAKILVKGVFPSL